MTIFRVALFFVACFIFSSNVTAQDGVYMSDNWGHYFADISGNKASILFDDGIAKEVEELPQNYSLLIMVNLREFRDDGLPTDDEAERLSEMTEAFDNVIEKVDGIALGQVTYDKKRHIFYLVHKETVELTADLEQFSKVSSYEIELGIRHDPKKETYWEDLYPSDDDRRVMGDMTVISSLIENGDDLLTLRIVDHWTYFQDKAVANRFLEWANDNGYQNVNIEKQGTFLKRTYCVRTQHESEVTIGTISKHTLAHDRKARELGGDYDGWETFVVKAQE